MSSGERVNQNIVKPGVNHSDASFFSLYSMPTALFAVSSCSLSPVNFSGWGKLKQRTVLYNQDWSILAPNPVPVPCLEQLFNAIRKRSKHSPLKSHTPCLLFEFGISSLKIFYVETALGKGKVKESYQQEIFLQNHAERWMQMADCHCHCL